MRFFLILLAGAAGAAATKLPAPSDAQLKMMDMGLAQFMVRTSQLCFFALLNIFLVPQHFSVDPWSSIQHNCVGTDPACIPASKFNPTNLSTDQWVETAVAFGGKT